jgi:hypothetical protein
MPYSSDFYLVDASLITADLNKSIEDCAPALTIERIMDLEWFELAQLLDVDTHADEGPEDGGEDEITVVKLNRHFSERLSAVSEEELEEIVEEWQEGSEYMQELEPEFVLSSLLRLQSLIQRAKTTRKRILLASG